MTTSCKQVREVVVERCVCAYIHTYYTDILCVDARVCVFTCMCMCMCICMCMCMCKCTDLCMYMRKYICMCMCVCAYVHMRICVYARAQGVHGERDVQDATR